MATLAEVLDEMADTIRAAVVSVTDIDVQVEPRMVISPSPPTIDIYPADPSDDPLLGGMGDLVGAEQITVRVRVTTADTEAGQDLLLAFMDDEDPLSILVALADEPTLNGLASTIDCRSRSGYVLFPVPDGAGALLGCLFSYVVVKAQS